MNINLIKDQLETKGYCIIHNIITKDDIDYCKELYYKWKDDIIDHDKMHKSVDPHGIYKYHNVGHTRHAWYLRTKQTIQNIYKSLYETDELIVSFDGCCYIPKDCNRKDNCWTHTDQAPNKQKFECYQGFVSLTDNKERTLVVYEGSHLIHSKYFKDRNISNSKNWQLIEHDYLKTIEDTKKILNVPAGSLVLWDSRTFHQNQYGKPNSEERLVQYICYFSKSHPKNTKKMAEKRLKYFKEKRTTSHWPAPIYVNSLQPRTYGNESLIIDYNSLPSPDLNDIEDKIMDLII
jgi:hypothetical protein